MIFFKFEKRPKIVKFWGPDLENFFHQNLGKESPGFFFGTTAEQIFLKILVVVGNLVGNLVGKKILVGDLVGGNLVGKLVDKYILVDNLVGCEIY